MEKLITARQVSDLLEVKTDTVYEWVHRGLIPYVKLGRLVRFKKIDIFHWVDVHTVRSKSSSDKAKRKEIQKILQREFPLN